MSIKKKKFRPKDGQPLADKFKFKYKFKATHLLIFAVSLFILSFLITQKRDRPQISAPTNNEGQSGLEENIKRIEISGVFVTNFFNQTGQDDSSGYFTLAQTPDYHIFYFETDNLFYISITSYPFEEHRGIAEQKLLELLAIGKTDACKLNVDITTPAYANPDKAGEVYNLSFCSKNN